MKLIFLHGSGGCKESWQYQVQFFENADAIDLPGHPEGKPCTSIDDYVEWLRAYIQERSYGDVVLVGHSLGGAIAFLYALKYPDDLKGIVAVGSGARLRVNAMFLEELEIGFDLLVIRFGLSQRLDQLGVLFRVGFEIHKLTINRRALFALVKLLIDECQS